MIRVAVMRLMAMLLIMNACDEAGADVDGVCGMLTSDADADDVVGDGDDDGDYHGDGDGRDIDYIGLYRLQ